MSLVRFRLWARKMAAANIHLWQPFLYLRCVYQDTYGTYIFSQSENRYFLKNTLLPLSIYSVWQKFYILRWNVRVMKDIFTEVSCISYAGVFYKMSCACPLFERFFCASLRACTCNIKFVKFTRLEMLESFVDVFLTTYIPRRK